jgi:polyisoprenoid-binding protein YceI
MISRLCLFAVAFSTTSVLAAPRTFSIDEAQSLASAHVGKTGFASFAGHEHVVLARKMQGEVILDAENLAQSSVDLIIDTRALKVREEGEPDGDAPKVQQAMRAPNQLNVDEHRTIHFRSSGVTGKQTGPGAFELAVVGDLSLHGVSKPLTVQIKAEVKGDLLLSAGKLVIKLSDFGIEATKAAGGLVKVENDVPVEFKIAARATTP